MIWVDHPEEAVLKVLWAVHSAAVKLKDGENRKKKKPLLWSAYTVCAPVCVHQSSMNIDLNVWDFIYKIWTPDTRLRISWFPLTVEETGW